MERLKQRWKDWMISQAAPLWSSAGFHSALGIFHESLAFSGRADNPSALRMMPQMRQVASFAILGSLPEGQTRWRDLARSVMERCESLYFRRDGQKGWIFSITPQGGIAACKRDLYGHAFVLFAYAQLGKAFREDDPNFYIKCREKSLAQGREIFELFQIETSGGDFLENSFWRESVPWSGEHAQNPWMHLLEACLALYEIYGDGIWQRRARKIIALFRKYLVTSEVLLPEKLDAGWEVFKAAEKCAIEPGHLYEWQWLLGEAQRMLPLEVVEIETITEISGRFERFCTNSLCQNQDFPPIGTFLINALIQSDLFPMDFSGERVQVSDGAIRLWPQTERLRLSASPYVSFGKDSQKITLERQSALFFEKFLPPALKGGWIDRLTEKGARASSVMPASSFYHILSAYLAIREHA